MYIYIIENKLLKPQDNPPNQTVLLNLITFVIPA